MLEQIFLKVIEMSLAASMVIAAVFIVRILLKRFPKYISYMLWSVVLLRLLCPVTLESAISPVPNLKPVFYEHTSEKYDVSTGGQGDNSPGELSSDGFDMIGTDGEAENISETGQIIPIQVHPDTFQPDTFQPDTDAEIPEVSRQESSTDGGIAVIGTDGKAESISDTGQVTPIQVHPDKFQPDTDAEMPELSRQELFILLGKYVWISGIGIMLLYFAVSVVRIRRKVSVSIPLKENIYITDERVSPFVMGILRPRIYLPGNLGPEEQEYIILHEKFHIRRLDHVAKPIAFAALCIHWFNPLVWIAFVLFCKDMEMSCDEAVIKRMGENIRADYSASLLALSTPHRIIRGIPVDFGEGDTKGRVKNLASFRKTRKSVAAVLIAGVVILIVCLASTHKTLASDGNEPQNEINGTEGGETPDTPDEPDEAEQLIVSLDITEHYITHTGNPSNFYYIDEDNILWGSGRNNYGQLGQGTQDYDFHEDMVKIAENVVHVDYSQKGFVIFLTEDHELYGMGNAGCGALLMYEKFNWDWRRNGYAVTTPILLIEDAVYARCGREDIVCLKEDGTVWTWGMVYNDILLSSPQKILENAVLVTGGWYNHAALLRDGTVWTWGYNDAENCGVADLFVVNKPTKVAEDVVMVWTDLAMEVESPQPDADDIAMAWTGRLKYNTEYENIAEFGGIYPYFLQNTVIQKADGSYWVCGKDVGTKEKEIHGAESNYSIICTHEFHLCE